MVDWDDFRFFLAIARTGSLTAAAQELRVAQSTVGRRLTSLETTLGVRLLHRTPDGYVLTLAGESVRAHAERLEEEVVSLQRSVAGHDTRLEGLVRINCTETLAAHMLAECLTKLQAEHPGISIELIPSAKPLSLSMREADVALRLNRIQQNDLIVRRVGQISYGLYASPDYIGRQGNPEFEAGCPGHKLLLLINDLDQDAQFGWVTDLAQRAHVGLQTSSHEALQAATRAGGGMACLARFRADPDSGLLRLATPTLVPSTDIWLVVHKDNRSIPRIRTVLTAVTSTIKSYANTLHPQP